MPLIDLRSPMRGSTNATTFDATTSLTPRLAKPARSARFSSD